MKQIVCILSLFLTLGVFNTYAQCTGCGGCGKNKSGESTCETGGVCNSDEVSQSEIKAYYFHANRRCATCKAVESVTKEAIKEYGDKSVKFISLSIEDKKNKDIIKKYKIGGQTLLIVRANKTENLTNYAFMNARTKPAKLKAKVKSAIDKLKK
jgi:thiol-disulfide isomerase/thioredoxin